MTWQMLDGRLKMRIGSTLLYLQRGGGGMAVGSIIQGVSKKSEQL